MASSLEKQDKLLDALKGILDGSVERNVAVRQIVSRAILRALPLLCLEGRLLFWLERFRAKYVLAYYDVCKKLGSVESSAFDYELLETINLSIQGLGQRAFDSFDVNSAASAHLAEKTVKNIAMAISTGMSIFNRDSSEILFHSKQAISYVFDAVPKASLENYYSKIKLAVFNDIEQVAGDLFDYKLTPLWVDPSDEVNGWKNRYIKMLNELANHPEVYSEDAVELIELCMQYEELFLGSVSDSVRFEKSDYIELNDGKPETTPHHSAPISPTQVNYTASRRQLPEATSHEDHLNRQPLISALAAVLAHKSNSEHQTIGLLGDWGIGKSTWLRLLKKELLVEHKEQVYLFGEFNAWAYEHTDNLQAGIAQEVIKALSSPATRLEDIDHALADQIKESKFAFVKRWLGWKYDRAILTAKFAVQLNGGELLKLAFLLLLALCPLVFSIPELISDYLASKAATQSQALYRGAGVVGNALWFLGFGVYFVKEFPKLFANPLAKEMLTYLRLPDYAKHLGTVPVMRRNIETLCNIRLKSSSEKPTRLLFVVDDLDRCGHDGIVKVFEAVRLVLDIKNVTVIIAVDQHIALAALALHYEEVAKHHKLKNPNAIARDYLAKVIHLPIILANPMGADIESYLKRLWLASTSKEDHEIVEKEQLDYVQQMVAVREKSESERAVASSSKGNSEMQSVNEPSLRTAAGAEFINNDALPARDPKESVHSGVNQSVIERPEVATLSAAQRRAFIFWLNYFALTNPRQVKRLNNTYNLLLNCYSDVDRLPVLTDLPEPMPKTLFPMMMALITMEYLNSMGDWDLRNALRSQLFIPSVDSKDAALNVTPLTKEFISAFHLLLSEHDGLVEKVRPFVLPAIEMH